MPLARFEARFLCECAEIAPLAVGQMGWRNFGKYSGGVKSCLQAGWRDESCLRHRRCKELFTGRLIRCVRQIYCRVRRLRRTAGRQARLVVGICRKVSTAVYTF